MAYLIGMDEAGYGPNLGPLVITATAWRVPDDVVADDLYDRLSAVVDREAASSEADAERRLAIADSKALYQAGKGLSRLETGTLASLGLLGRRPRDCDQLWRALVPTAADQLATQVCFDGFRLRLPVETNPTRLDNLTTLLRATCRTARVRLVAVRSKPVFPAVFNRLVQQYDTKGAALTHLTFELLGELLLSLDDGPVSVVCDKHGGRNRYGAFLQTRFDESLVEVVQESKLRSDYRFGPPARRVRIELRARAETHLSVALASMFSKYLRELAMRAFNQFWQRHVRSLRPTAGYPVDARRFKLDIATAQRELGIEDRDLWRDR